MYKELDEITNLILHKEASGARIYLWPDILLTDNRDCSGTNSRLQKADCSVDDKANVVIGE